MVDLSVVITNWNGRDFLRDCLESLQELGGVEDCEVIVVDNGSTDGSSEMVEEFFPHVALLRNAQNLGFAKANNLGLQKTTGRYVALINSDITVRDGCLAGLCSFMDQNPKAGMVGPRILNSDGTLQYSCRPFPSLRGSVCRSLGLDTLFPRNRWIGRGRMEEWAYDEARSAEVLSGCFWIVRREALTDVGLLDERFFIYGEDLDWCKRFHQAGWDVVFCPDAEAVHYGGGSSRNAPIQCFLDLQESSLRYWRKHHGRISMQVHKMTLLFGNSWRLVARAIGYCLLSGKRPVMQRKMARHAAALRWLLGFGKGRKTRETVKS